MGGMIQRLQHRFTFLLSGLVLAVIVANGFLMYGAAHPPTVITRAVQHERCGEPAIMRAEDYELLGSLRGDIEVARFDFCDPVQVLRRDGTLEFWVWMSIETTAPVFSLSGWGRPWVDVETPFPADSREPANPFWRARDSIRGIPGGFDYLGGEGLPCLHGEARRWGVDLLYFEEEGFQVPVGERHTGWLCLYFDNGNSIPPLFTLTTHPYRGRITQWVDKLFETRESGFPAERVPLIQEETFCQHVAETHVTTIQPDGHCEQAVFGAEVNPGSVE